MADWCSGEDIYRFIYFNHMNLALKTSLKQKGAAITNDTMVVLNQMHNDFERSTDIITDVMVRTTNDRWIVGKKADQREVYVIFEDKKQPLLEIQGKLAAAVRAAMLAPKLTHRCSCGAQTRSAS